MKLSERKPYLELKRQRCIRMIAKLKQKIQVRTEDPRRVRWIARVEDLELSIRGYELDMKRADVDIELEMKRRVTVGVPTGGIKVEGQGGEG